MGKLFCQPAARRPGTRNRLTQHNKVNLGPAACKTSLLTFCYTLPIIGARSHSKCGPPDYSPPTPTSSMPSETALSNSHLNRLQPPRCARQREPENLPIAKPAV